MSLCMDFKKIIGIYMCDKQMDNPRDWLAWWSNLGVYSFLRSQVQFPLPTTPGGHLASEYKRMKRLWKGL